MGWRALALFLCWSAPFTALAHSITDELGVGWTQPTQNNPRSGYLYDRLGGEATLNDKWSVRGDAILSHDQASPPTSGAAFGSSGGTIPFFDLGVDFDPNDHLSFGLEGDLSPKVNQTNDAQVTVDGPDGGSVSADADLRTVSSSLGGVFSIGLDTAGESNFEMAGTASAGVMVFNSVQSIARLATAAGNYDLAVARGACKRLQAAGKERSGCAALLGEPANVTQGRLTLNADATLHEDTDLSLTGSYYFYDKDPTTVGYFTLTTAGRLGGTATSFGQGLAIAPYQWTLRPDVSHLFFGKLKIDVSYQYGMYWPGQGYSQAIGLKVQFKFNRAWKAWVSVTGEKDIDGQGNPVSSAAFALGARWKF